MSPKYTLFVGTFIQLPRFKSDEGHKLAITRGALWVSTADGTIEGFDWSIANDRDLKRFLRHKGWTVVDDKSSHKGKHGVKVTLVVAREEENEFFFPGFIDTHIHAPQYPNAGLFGDAGLLHWLLNYTFPIESSFGSTKFPSIPPPNAYRVYNQVIARTLANGTTCASYFATIHVPATNLLASLCLARGQRALIGRVCMDRPEQCPEYLRDESPDIAIDKTQASIDHIHTIDPEGALIKPIVTPRFAPSCTPRSLGKLSKLAASYSPPLHIQTHLAENLDELKLVQDLYPEARDYTSVYNYFKLLTPRTILAHCVHLSDDERAMIADNEAKLSHCPASNSALGSGICEVRKAIDSGITVGLGTDVSGGYSPSILETVRQACLVSRLLPHMSGTSEGQNKDNDGVPREVLSIEEALYLATRGGAAVVDMAEQIGGFDQGMVWDAQLVKLGKFNPAGRWGKTGGVETAVDVFDEGQEWKEKVHKWVWNGDSRNVRMVWVGGKLVHRVWEEGEDRREGGGWMRWVIGAVGVGVVGWAVVRRLGGGR
ncbi:chlorohydrolase family protein [Aspergillus tubingensis]|uniref:chlorohydrolase family protein n=1 Tax=Aspergillus tubingensis TaxID=5068 RepID=UPI001578B91E|nr:chlorohydrolase family protein [Aspergillus tubingensis]GFN10883.1 chlorohydrolase family protein [Aspergillus tubingensis]